VWEVDGVLFFFGCFLAPLHWKERHKKLGEWLAMGRRLTYFMTASHLLDRVSTVNFHQAWTMKNFLIQKPSIHKVWCPCSHPLFYGRTFITGRSFSPPLCNIRVWKPKENARDFTPVFRVADSVRGAPRVEWCDVQTNHVVGHTRRWLRNTRDI
jgi:hypothetical protein